MTLRALVTPGRDPYQHSSDALTGPGAASNPQVNKAGAASTTPASTPTPAGPGGTFI